MEEIMEEIVERIRKKYEKGQYISLIELDMIGVLPMGIYNIRRAVTAGRIKAVKNNPTKLTGKWLVDKGIVKEYQKLLKAERKRYGYKDLR